MSTGYEDREAPDCANAASTLARSKGISKTPSTARWQESLALPIKPLDAQELHDEEMLQWKPRSPQQAKQDKRLVEDLLQRNAKPSSLATPKPPTPEPST